jgi:hypothetical protein
VSRREWWILALIFALSLIVRLLTAWPLDQPGYTDAYYYAVGAEQLAAGQGFSEPFVWNYLDPPESVPQPGYLYWMPLAAVVGWLGLETLGGTFGALQAPFVLLSALLPIMAFVVAWDLTGKLKHALLAGVLAIFPGFYAHVFVLPDNFAPFALVGSLCLWATGRGLRDQKPLWFGLAGLAAGLGHLARADGLLLAIVALAAALIPKGWRQENPVVGSRKKLADPLLLLAGYCLVMAPWFARNWQVHGSLLAGTGFSTAFLTSYDDMFAYNRPPTLKSYLEWGWSAILQSKGQALLLNLQRLWIENLMIILLPFSVIGLVHHRWRRLLWPFLLYGLMLFLAMTFAFTYAGMRGGLFHSGSALLPFLYAAVGPGLEGALRWLARRLPGWNPRTAWPVFGAGLVGIALVVTIFALWRAGVLDGTWNERSLHYMQIGNVLDTQGVPDAVVMVGDAPAFTWHTEHSAIAIPNELLDTILAVADRYGAQYLVLDGTRPRTTDALFASEASHPRLVLEQALEIDGAMWQLYEISP